MHLKNLLQSAGILPGLADPEVTSLCFDSREAVPGSLFFALPGKHADGTAFIQQAAERGAIAAIAEQALPVGLCPIMVVPNARIAMADIGGAFFDHPDRMLKCVGVTGTNGKTTTTYLIRHIFEHAAQRCGLIGTVKYIVADEDRPAPHTTPESIDIQKILSEIRDTGGRAVAMEVSSHAIVQKRIRGIEFDAAVFTNLTQDHLDYHGSMDEYFEAKIGLFEALALQKNKKGRAIVNLDDRYGQQLVDQFFLNSRKLRNATFLSPTLLLVRTSATEFPTSNPLVLATSSIYQRQKSSSSVEHRHCLRL
jgi:UDP-N-acetylmuramoyl-L-alanyl-D-glutamate--2,6-diaminopimelate ligase